MPIFFIATGPALALLAKRSEWRADRKQVLLNVQVRIDEYSSNKSAPPDIRRDSKPRFRGDSPQP
jgi:hypothetical protein